MGYWKDKFKQVNPDAPVRDRNGWEARYHYGTEVKMLGEEGLAGWLVKSLCGPKAEYQTGYFMFLGLPGDPDDLNFLDVFVWTCPEFDAQTVDIARKGFAAALKQFDPATGTVPGLTVLLECAAALGMEAEFEEWMPVLERMKATLPPPSPQDVPAPTNS